MRPPPLGVPAVLALLCTINMLNYLDRGIVPGAPIQFSCFIDASLDHPHTSVWLGMLTSAFIGCYSVASPVFAQLSRTQNHAMLLGVGLCVWIVALLASAASGWAGPSLPSFITFLLARAVSGVGEAAYQCIVPPYIEDIAPPRLRGLCLSFFFCAVPVGTALGYEYGALVSRRGSWGWAFFGEALFMTPLTAAVFMLPSAAVLRVRGAGSAARLSTPLLPSISSSVNDSGTAPPPLPAPRAKPSTEADKRSFLDVLASLLLNPVYVCLALGYAAQCATVLALSTFGPDIMIGFGSFTTQANAALGFAVAVSAGGLIGTPCGGLFADRLVERSLRRIRSGQPGGGRAAAATTLTSIDGGPALALADAQSESPLPPKRELSRTNDLADCVEAATLSGLVVALMSIALILMGAAAYIAPVHELRDTFLVLIGLGVCFNFSTTAPIVRLAMLISPSSVRSLALAVMTFIMHAFGDVPSPVLIGLVKDTLAPDCGVANSSQPLDCSGGGPEPPVLPCTGKARDGLHTTIFLAILWSGWAVLLWGIAYHVLRGRAHSRLASGAARMASVATDE